MQKQAPSPARILIAAGFAVSCFVLLLFLWIAFGGPTPLGAKSYRVTAYFPEATQLAVESDVRIGGVSVGKVKETGLAPPNARIDGNDTTAAVIEIEPQYAPISDDARAILRQKTLLGETYIELTSGTEPTSDGEVAQVSLGAQAAASDSDVVAPQALEEGGTLGVGRTVEANQIDEFFNAIDDETRESFQRWQASAAVAIRDRGLGLNDALGNLAPFLTDTTELFDILASQEDALRSAVADTGTTFEALSDRGAELTSAIRGGRNTFEALGSEQEALAQLFQILPVFQRESRATIVRLDQFQESASPLIAKLQPVAEKLRPTLSDVRRLSPNLRDLFVNLEDLNRVSLRGLPALRDFLNGLAPVIDELEHFLANLNPLLRYLDYQKATVADFLAGPGTAMSGTLDGFPDDPARRHFLRQLSVLGTESLSISENRLNTNRGNGYLADGALNGMSAAAFGIFPNFDCRNTDYRGPSDPAPDRDEEELKRGETDPDLNMGKEPDPAYAPCHIEGDFPGDPDFGTGRVPEIFEDP
ncbi:MAG: MlaD family protein [Actinomycetota bacterium]|nr:MlaD family protein [Actinomycetota bacterium]